MDSLARVVHSYVGNRDNPIATAVSFHRARLVLAHNETNDAIKQRDRERLQAVSDVVNGRRSATEVARELEPSCGLPIKNSEQYPLQRIEQDLRKLRDFYQNGPQNGSQDELHTLFRNTFGPREVSYNDVSRDRVSKKKFHHAEAAVAHSAANLDPTNLLKEIGVSKLPCGLCHDYLTSENRISRGTHGEIYANWMSPDSNTAHGTNELLNPYQQPSDSGSSPQHSSRTSVHPSFATGSYLPAASLPPSSSSASWSSGGPQPAAAASRHSGVSSHPSSLHAGIPEAVPGAPQAPPHAYLPAPQPVPIFGQPTSTTTMSPQPQPQPQPQQRQGRSSPHSSSSDDCCTKTVTTVRRAFRR